MCYLRNGLITTGGGDPVNTEIQPDAAKSNLSRWVIKGIIGLLVFLMIAMSGVYFYVVQALKPVEASSPTEVAVNIPAGASTGEIGQILEEKQLIRSAFMFKWLLRYEGVASQLQAGEYRFKQGASIDQIVAKMKQGDIVLNTVKFTIPEGFSVEQIADRLSAEGLVDRQKFLDEADHGEFSFSWFSDLPKKANVKHRLEGFLFPDTYEVKKGATEKEIIERMLAQFDKEFKPEWREALKQKKLSIYDAVTLASIVEREVVADNERPIVAGIFFNRIKDGWKLQSCATVQFVLGKQRDRITYKDLKVDSPYNTYENAGLPVGPIANPGAKSLQAVVYPEKTDYFFFVTKKDGTQEHLFARTFAEHIKNNAKSQGSW